MTRLRTVEGNKTLKLWALRNFFLIFCACLCVNVSFTVSLYCLVFRDAERILVFTGT